jgi:hypothetical protein
LFRTTTNAPKPTDNNSYEEDDQFGDNLTAPDVDPGMLYANESGPVLPGPSSAKQARMNSNPGLKTKMSARDKAALEIAETARFLRSETTPTVGLCDRLDAFGKYCNFINFKSILNQSILPFQVITSCHNCAISPGRVP